MGRPRTTESDPNFFRIPTPEYGYGKSTGTGENSKEVTEYGTNSEVFENAKYGYGTMTEFFEIFGSEKLRIRITFQNRGPSSGRRTEKVRNVEN